MVQCPKHLTEKLLYIKSPMKVISGLLPETWGYFCMKNFISTTRNSHSHRKHTFCLPCSRYTLVVSLVWLVGPLNPWAPADPPLSGPV